MSRLVLLLRAPGPLVCILYFARMEGSLLCVSLGTFPGAGVAVEAVNEVANGLRDSNLICIRWND